nr:MAG: RdRp [Downy mildew lesion associated ambivirus 4]
MKEDVYRTLITQLCVPGSPPQWPDAFNTIISLTQSQRKNLANLARAQVYVTTATTLHQLLSTNLSEFLITKFEPLVQEPFSAGLLLSMLRLAPLSKEEIKDAYTKSVLKERLVMDRTGLPTTINYNTFFGSPNEPIVIGQPPNPKSALYVQAAIDGWIKDECNRLHYPKLSRKTTSDDSRDNVKSLNIRIGRIQEEESVNQVDMEQILHQTGIPITGPCEMRQKWYPANFGPRTYYAAGGDAFHLSKHMAQLWTRLADSIPPTDRRLRVIPTRLRLNPDWHALIYDLTSFTSNLHEQKYFIRRLGLYCLGNAIRYVDATRGIVEDDLGMMILRYNDLNDQAPYSLRRIHKDTPDLAHHTAGFLGVYGNIATATFLHGCVMLQLCNSENELNVAGDDGIINEDDSARSFSVLRHLGELEWTKCFKTYEEGCVHLKRPLKQLGSRLVQGNLIMWPSFEFVLQDSNMVDPRYPFIRDLKRIEWRNAISSSVTGFLTSLTTIAMESWMVDVSYSVLQWIYRTMDLPMEGHIPQISGGDLGFVPQIMHHCIGLEPKQNTIKRIYQGQAKVSIRRFEPCKQDELEFDDTFECNSNPRLGYLTSMGYLERTRPWTIAWGEEGLRLLLKEYFEPVPVVFSWRVVREIPEWFQLLETER